MRFSGKQLRRLKPSDAEMGGDVELIGEYSSEDDSDDESKVTSEIPSDEDSSNAPNEAPIKKPSGPPNRDTADKAGTNIHSDGADSIDAIGASTALSKAFANTTEHDPQADKRILVSLLLRCAGPSNSA